MHLVVFLAQLERTEAIFYREITKLASDAIYLPVANLVDSFVSGSTVQTSYPDYLYCVHLCDQRAATQIHICLALSD